MPRGSDDRRETTAGRAAGESRRWRLPAQRGRGRGAAADGDRRGRADRRGPARTLRRAHDLSQRLPGPGPGHTPRQPAAAHPQLRQGSYFPPFLEPRKTSEKALVAVIQEAWVGGVSTRRVDDLVQAMGLAGISK